MKNYIPTFDEFVQQINESKVADAIMNCVEQCLTCCGQSSKNNYNKCVKELSKMTGVSTKRLEEILSRYCGSDPMDAAYDAFEEIMQVQEHLIHEDEINEALYWYIVDTDNYNKPVSNGFRSEGDAKRAMSRMNGPYAVMQLDPLKLDEACSTDHIEVGSILEIGGQTCDVVNIVQEQNCIKTKLLVRNINNGNEHFAHYNGHMYILGEKVN